MPGFRCLTRRGGSDLYLEYWLENIVKRNRRPATYNLYEMIVRLYLIPGLGNRRLHQPVRADRSGRS